MITLAILTLVIWLYLLFARGTFWQAGPELPVASPATTPSVAVVVPAPAMALVVTASSVRSCAPETNRSTRPPIRRVVTLDRSGDCSTSRA